MSENNLEEAFHSAKVSTIEVKYLLELVQGFDGDAGDAIDIINDWLQEIPPMIEETRQAYDAGDAETVKQSAHAVKSAARSVGAMKLGDMGETLQRKGAENSLSEADQQLVNDYVSDAEQVVRDLGALKDYLESSQ